MTLDYRPNDPAVLADPFPLYRRLRDEDPAHWSPLLKAWVLTRYDDVRRVCLDTRMSSDRLRPFFATLPSAEAARIGELIRYLTLWMVFRDPPEHTRLRRLASKVFNVRSMHALRPNVEALTAWLLGEIGGREEFDFIAEFAGPLPALVIMDMLGVPRDELARLKRLSDEMALFIGSARDSPEKYAPRRGGDARDGGLFRELIAARRAAPQRDLLSELVALEDDGDRLSEDELVATCILLLFAGHETTTHHLANGLPRCCASRASSSGCAPIRRSRRPRSRSCCATTARSARRCASCRRRSDFHGTHAQGRRARVPADERGEPRPARLSRAGPRSTSAATACRTSPSASASTSASAFPLARLEGQVALPAVLARWRRIEPAGERREWIDSMVIRGMQAMPLRVRS